MISAWLIPDCEVNKIPANTSPIAMKDTASAVLMVSCHEYLDRMSACAETWVQELYRIAEIPTIFVVGDPSLRDPYSFNFDHNILKVRTGDDYWSLSAKVQEALRWVVDETNITHVFKCDDDTFINPQVFSEFVLHGAYIGSLMSFEEDPSLVYTSGGAGYFLNREAMEIVVSDPEVAANRFEDVAVGYALKKEGIFPISVVDSDSISLEPLEHEGMRLVAGKDLWQQPSIHLQREPPRAMYLTYEMYKRGQAYFEEEKPGTRE